MNYVDASVLVAALTKEPRTRLAETWLIAGRDLAIGDWVIAEFSAALSIKLRVGTVDAEGRRAALDALAVMTSESFSLLPVGRAQFRNAARLADQ